MPAPTRNGKQSKYNLGATEVLMDLEVPSGALCQVRRPGPMGLMRAGLIDQLDILGGLVQTEHVDRVDGRQSEEDLETRQRRQAMEILKDRSKLEAADRLMNRIICYVVVQPHIEMPEVHDEKADRWRWIPNEERDPKLVYADTVSEEDKSFIMQFVMGGTADIATFRKEQQEAMGGLEPGQGAQGSPQ